MAENNKDDIDEPSSTSTTQNNDALTEERVAEQNEAAEAASSSKESNRPSSDAPQRREENPFSFKRFLNQDRGARRKEYSPDGTPVLVNTSEMSSMLPDFVQDHLVVEASYMSSPTHHVPIPFDLPISVEDRIDPSVQMSLPDFLSDGPIHSQRGEEAAAYLNSQEAGPTNGLLSSPSGPSSRNETERLQREVDSLRRQLHEKNRRIHVLESEVNLLHNRDARMSDSLEFSLQQAENNLMQTSKRMIAAEKAVAKLKADNKMLRERLELLEEDQGAGAAAAGPSTSYSSNVRNQRLAQDLRGAATAAEAHLRSLMSGIEDLRMMASAIEDRPQFDYDFSEGASGPAL